MLNIALPNFETGIMKHRSFPIIFFKVIKNSQHWVEFNTDAVKRHFLPPEWSAVNMFWASWKNKELELYNSKLKKVNPV